GERCGPGAESRGSTPGSVPSPLQGGTDPGTQAGGKRRSVSLRARGVRGEGELRPAPRSSPPHPRPLSLGGERGGKTPAGPPSAIRHPDFAPPAPRDRGGGRASRPDSAALQELARGSQGRVRPGRAVRGEGAVGERVVPRAEE